MSYEPGTLLTVSPKIRFCKIDYFKSWERRESDANKLYKLKKEFEVGDNILIVDYKGYVQQAYDPRFNRTDYFYLVWINGEECLIRDDILEITEYYEVVK